MTTSTWRRAFLLTVAAATLFVAWSPSDAASTATSINNPPVTQTHTLFYNMASCAPDGEVRQGYAITIWYTRFQRTAGADREISKAKYQTSALAYACSTGQRTDRDTGVKTYYPKWGASNDITWQLQLNWPMVFVFPGWGQIGSSTRGYYTLRPPHPPTLMQTICTTVSLAHDFDACSNL